MTNFLKHITLWLMESRGKKRYAIACLLGICVTLAFPPVYIFPLLWIGFSGLLISLSGTLSKRQAFFTGWWFGFGHFVSGTYWIAFALLTDAAQFGWMVPFAVFGISAVLALYCAIITLLTQHIPVQSPISKLLLFSILWTTGEFARTYLLSGFPWNLLGYVWTFSDAMIQPASIIGTYGMGFFTLLAAASLAPFLITYTQHQRLNFIPPVIAISIIVLGGVWGHMRLTTPVEMQDTHLRIVQGNIKQDMKWEEAQRELHFKKYLNLTHSEGFEKTDYVIWPETAVPYIIREDNESLMDALKYATPENGALLTGALRLQDLGYDYNIWNSFFVITQKQGVYAYYDKFHLVPFGEYVPLRSFIPGFVQKITQGAKDFSTGSGPKILTLPDHSSLLPLICYEAIFPQYATTHSATQDRNTWILNVTNDAWFGVSSGPYQHLNMVKMRAVEQGVPLIRAANTGISAVIDPFGRILKSIPLNTTGIIDSPLPKKISDNTIYSIYENIIILFIIVLSVTFLAISEKLHKNTRVYS